MLEIQQWMKDRFGFGVSEIAKMSRKKTDLLTSKVETLEEKADWLQKELHLHDEELSKLISVKSEILLFNMEEKIKPKIKYLRRTFQLNGEEVKDLLLRCHYLFNYTIEKNLEKKLNFYAKLIGKRAAKKLVFERSYLIANYSLERKLEPRLEEVRKSGKKIMWDETLISRLAMRTDDQWKKYGLGDAN